MDSRQINDAMRRRLPVVYAGARYERIAEFVAWYDGAGKRRLSVGLIRGNCIERVPADKIELAAE